MIRFIYVIIVNFFRIIYYVPKMAYYARHSEKYSENDRHALVQRLSRIVERTARVKTEHIGAEDLPADGGYILFANHEGRYDPMSILTGHDLPLSFLIDQRRAEQFMVKQFAAVTDSVGIDKESTKSQISALRSMARGVRAGKRYLVFPEGIYDKDKKNTTYEFKSGCFIAATHAKCPIIPVTLVDSYKVFGENSFKRVTTKVIYHEPICYEKYKDMKPDEISKLVRQVIDNELRKNRG